MKPILNILRSEFAAHFILAFLLLYTSLVYFPSLSGSFIFDDEINITKNPYMKIDGLNWSNIYQASFSGKSGPLKRPIAMFSFAINVALAGFNPFYFKVTNLIIHLATGIAIFFLSNQIICGILNSNNFSRQSSKQSIFFSLVVTFVWLVHPINFTSVAYIVQRMTSLAALFSILSCIFYIKFRQKLFEGDGSWKNYAFGTILFLVLSCFTKEVGILTPIYFFLLENTFFKFKVHNHYPKKSIHVLFSIVLAVPIIALIIFLIENPSWLSSRFLSRDFDILSRLLTESRALVYYISLIYFPVHSRFALFHDDFTTSISLLQPYTTVFSAALIIFSICWSIYYLRKFPGICFGILFFISGHLLESTILPLELVHEHRNYLPSIGVIFSTCYFFLYTIKWRGENKYYALAVLLFPLVCSFSLFVRASYWGNKVDMYIYEASNHPNSARANYSLAYNFASLAEAYEDNSLKRKFYQSALKHFEKSAELDENDVNSLFAIFFMNNRLNKPFDRSHFLLLLHRLEFSPYRGNSINWVDTINKCILVNECHMAENNLYEIIDKSLGNRTISDYYKARLYIAASSLFLNSFNDPNNAISLLDRATALTPNNVEIRLLSAKIALAANDIPYAKIQLHAAKLLDQFGIFFSEIDQLNQYILNSKRAGPT